MSTELKKPPSSSSRHDDEIESIDKILERASLGPKDLAHIQKVLYGRLPKDLPLDEDVAKVIARLSDQHGFEFKAYQYEHVRDGRRQMTPPRVVRIGMIQNKSTPLPTTAPYLDQWTAIVHGVLEPMVDAAGLAGTNVLCFQEAVSMPFAFCTREKCWNEFAEDAETGRTVVWAQKKAAQYGMVVVVPILERDGVMMDIVWNTAVVIGHKGNVIGKSRKFHIPRVGDFNESTYYLEGNTGWPVFATRYGKIGIPICYSRHFPNTYLAHALSGAEILFNPSATVAGLSEPLWWTEQACNAVATSTFVGQINRVGTELMPNEFTSGDGRPAHRDFGHFYGTTMLTLPDGTRTPPLSRTRSGVLVTEVDLNLQRDVRDRWSFNMCGRLGEYGAFFAHAARGTASPLPRGSNGSGSGGPWSNDEEFRPQLVRDPEA